VISRYKYKRKANPDLGLAFFTDVIGD